MRPIVTDRVAWSLLVCLSVCLPVCLSVCHTSEPCTDRDAVWFEDSGGPNEPCIRWGSRSPWEGAILRGKGRPIVKYRDTLPSGPYAKIVNIFPVVVCWLFAKGRFCANRLHGAYYAVVHLYLYNYIKRVKVSVRKLTYYVLCT